MNIKKYMKSHELLVTNGMNDENSQSQLRALKEKHKRTILYMQHERMIHLRVTFAFSIFLLLTFGLALLKPLPLLFGLTGILLIMVVFYINHYFFLENTIQHWYVLMDEIEKQLNRFSDFQNN